MPISLEQVDQELEGQAAERAQQTAETLNRTVERQDEVAEVSSVETQETEVGTFYSVETANGDGADMLIDDGEIKAVYGGEQGLDMEVYGEVVGKTSEYAVASSFEEFDIDPDDTPQDISSYNEVKKS